MSASGLFPFPSSSPYGNAVPSVGAQAAFQLPPLASFPNVTSTTTPPVISHGTFPQQPMFALPSSPQVQAWPKLLDTAVPMFPATNTTPAPTGSVGTLPSLPPANVPLRPTAMLPVLTNPIVPTPTTAAIAFPAFPSISSPKPAALPLVTVSSSFETRPSPPVFTQLQLQLPPAQPTLALSAPMFTSSALPAAQSTFASPTFSPFAPLQTTFTPHTTSAPGLPAFASPSVHTPVANTNTNVFSFQPLPLQMVPISSSMGFPDGTSRNPYPYPTAFGFPGDNRPVPVALRNNQIEWSQRILRIYQKYNIYADTSTTGCGKTCVCIWAAQQFSQCQILNDPIPPLPYLYIVVICPLAVRAHWEEETSKRNMQCITITYESLRGTKNYPPSHGLLERMDIVSEGDREFTRFVSTELWRKMVNKGVMLVIDENQKAKNASDQSRAVQALLEPVHRSTVSKAAMLSFTPFESPENAVVALRLLGILHNEKLYNIDPHTKEFTALGIQEVINAANENDATATQRIVLETGMSKSKMSILCYNLLSGPIKAGISGAMSPPTNILGKLDAKNGFYKISGDNAQRLEDAVGSLSRAVGYKNGAIDHQQMSNNMGAVTKSLMAMEEAKLPDMVRVAWKKFQDDPYAKVIICLNYIESIKAVAAMLALFQPQILMGSTSAKKRQTIINTFNQPSLACRLIIMNPEVGGVGINLHDKSEGGLFRRYMWISPGFKMSIMAQAAGRIFRDSTTSDAFVRIFYGMNEEALREAQAAQASSSSNALIVSNAISTFTDTTMDNVAYEMKILEAIARKSKTNYGMLDEKTQSLVKLPGDWERYYEL